MNKEEIKNLVLENERMVKDGVITKEQALDVIKSMEDSFLDLSIKDQNELILWITEYEAK